MLDCQSAPGPVLVRTRLRPIDSALARFAGWPCAARGELRIARATARIQEFGGLRLPCPMRRRVRSLEMERPDPWSSVSHWPCMAGSMRFGLCNSIAPDVTRARCATVFGLHLRRSHSRAMKSCRVSPLPRQSGIEWRFRGLSRRCALKERSAGPTPLRPVRCVFPQQRDGWRRRLAHQFLGQSQRNVRPYREESKSGRNIQVNLGGCFRGRAREVLFAEQQKSS